MTARRPDVGWTTFHALDPRECDCSDGACVAAAIERTTALREAAPGVARCETPAGHLPGVCEVSGGHLGDTYEDALSLLRGPDDAAVAAARRAR